MRASRLLTFRRLFLREPTLDGHAERCMLWSTRDSVTHIVTKATSLPKTASRGPAAPWLRVRRRGYVGFGDNGRSRRSVF